MPEHAVLVDRNLLRRAIDDADVAAETELMERSLAVWRETGDAAGTAQG